MRARQLKTNKLENMANTNQSLVAAATKYQLKAHSSLQAMRGNSLAAFEMVRLCKDLPAKALKQQEQLAKLEMQLQAAALRLENQLVALHNGVSIIAKELPPAPQKEELVVIPTGEVVGECISNPDN